MGNILPLKEALLNAMKTAETSIAAAEYLETQFKQILNKNKMLDSSQDIVGKVEEFVQFVKFKLISSTQPWAGEQSKSSDFSNMQQNIAADAVEKLEGVINGMIKDLKLDVAINDLSQLVRGYTSEGKALDAKLIDSMDKLFNAWLAENNIVNKGSTLFDANDKGDIRVDEKKQQVKTGAQRIRDLISGKGFEAFLYKKGVQITSQLHSYPSATSEAEKQQAVADAIKAGTDTKEGLANEMGVEEQPTTSPSSSTST